MTEPRSCKTVRCAVYTRKSSEEGLEQAFNSLHAQREACEAYIQSQRHEGWSVIPIAYDDGGFSGGTMERPALQALLADIRSGKVDVIVVYKIDRLTRSLFDFAKIVEIFDAASVSFVSVTQSFNTTTSMGRLTLNVLLSFAQFEREVTGERIRDKIAASKRKGMWMGGNIPLGYDLKDRRLVINGNEAATVRTIFESYAELGTVRKVSQEIERLGHRTKHRKGGRSLEDAAATGGLPFGIGHLYTILRNPLYIGKVRHKHEIHPGEHEAIIASELWETVQARLAANSVERSSGTGTKSPSLLTGRIFDDKGNRLTPSHAVKGAKRYRYYSAVNTVNEHDAVLRLPATDIENLVVDAVRALLTDPKEITGLFPGAHRSPAILRQIIERARLLADLHADHGDAVQPGITRSLIARVDVSQNKVLIAVDRRGLAASLEIDDHLADPIIVERTITLRRQGREQRLILTSAAAEAKPDPSMIKAIARARRWFDMLKDRQVDSIADIGRRENAARAWISNQMPLAFLAPDITEAVIEGMQPVNLKLDRLIEIASASPRWTEQRAAFRAS